MSDALRLVLHSFAGWVNRRQLDVIDDLKEENIVLRDQLGGRRLRLSDAQRHRLAVRGKTIERNTVERILLEHGIEPAPERRKRTPWKAFLKAR